MIAGERHPSNTGLEAGVPQLRYGGEAAIEQGAPGSGARARRHRGWGRYATSPGPRGTAH